MKFLVTLTCVVLPTLGMKIMRVSSPNRPTQDRVGAGISMTDDVIVFPDEPVERLGPNRSHPLVAPAQLISKPTPAPGKLPIPMCKGGEDFCEEVEHYPRYFNKSMEDKEGSKMMEKLTASFATSPSIGLPAEDLTSYLDADAILPLRVRPVNQIEEIPLCAAKEEIIHPRVAKNIEEEYMFILNDGDKYIQGVRLEKCIKPDEPCHESIDEAAPSGFTTRCRQKYLYKKLLALSNDGSTMIQSFKIPSCCVCHLIPTFFSPQLRQSSGEEVVEENKSLAALRQEDADAVDLTEGDEWTRNLIQSFW